MLIKRDHLPWERAKDMLWICPECRVINTMGWYDEAERASKKLKQKVYVSHGSCFDNVCGKCKVNIAEPSSPILAEVYTHESYDEDNY